MRRALFLLAIGALVSAAPAAGQDEAAAPESGVLVVRAGRWFDGERFHENGVFVIRDGRVVDEAAPEDAKTLSFDEGVVVPGFVDALTTLGLPGAASERTEEITPRFAAADEFDPTDPRLARALAAGTTTAWISPGTWNVVGGRAAVIGAGADGFAVAASDAALEVVLTDDPASGNTTPRRRHPDSIYYRRPNTRMGVIWMLRQAFFESARPNSDEEHAAVREMLRGGAGLRITARRQEDVEAACRVAREFGLTGFVVADAVEGWRAAAALADRGAKVVVTAPTFGDDGWGPDGARAYLAGAAELHRAGIPFAIASGREGDGTGLREAAILACRYGLPREAALSAITGRAADLMGIGDRAGRLGAGRAADLVVFDGDPLEPASGVRLVIAGGRIVHQAGEAK